MMTILENDFKEQVARPRLDLCCARKYKEAAEHHHRRALVLTARKSMGLVVWLLHCNEPYRSKENRCT